MLSFASVAMTPEGQEVITFEAVLASFEGARADAETVTRFGATDLQVIRDWDLRFNADSPAGLIDRKALGDSLKLNAAQR